VKLISSLLDKRKKFLLKWERSKQQHVTVTPEFAMITNFNTYLQGCIGKLNQGWGKKALVALLGVLMSVAAMSPSSARAAASTGAISQLEFLQWMVQLVGDKNQFSANSKAEDYVNWAKVKGMTPASGWQPGAKLSREALAQVLVQLFNLNPKKYGGDYVRILAREGIELPSEAEISRKGLVGLVSEFSFFEPFKHHKTGTSPFKHPNSGKGNGDQPSPGNSGGSHGQHGNGSNGNGNGHNKGNK
jgi:hypothetical protein